MSAVEKHYGNAPQWITPSCVHILFCNVMLLFLPWRGRAYLSTPLNLGWPCDWLGPKECDRSNIMPVPESNLQKTLQLPLSPPGILRSPSSEAQCSLPEDVKPCGGQQKHPRAEPAPAGRHVNEATWVTAGKAIRSYTQMASLQDCENEITAVLIH